MPDSLIPDSSSPIQLTPEQDKRARQAWDERRFDPDSYQTEIMGPELSPQLQVAVAEAQIVGMDNPIQSDPEALDWVARKKQENEKTAREFCFLDPADYADEAARIGRPMSPQELLRKLQDDCRLTCWFSLASAAMIAKELNPRDVALAYSKIGENPENLHDAQRWRDAIAEIRQEEAGRQKMCNYERIGLQVVRAGESEPTYVCWLPACQLREYALVKFDSHGIPDFQIPGWRDAIIALIRNKFITEDDSRRVFGEATGPASKRFNMILAGLRHAREEVETYDVLSSKAIAGEIRMVGIEAVLDDPPAVLCSECNHPHAHFLWCSQFEAWLNAITKEITPDAEK